MNNILPVLKKILFFENHKMAKKGPKMVALQAEITEVLYYYDPVGLAALHCPEDEYESEAVSILHALRDVKDQTELRWMVYDVFVSWFGEGTTLPSSDRCYRYIADEIWNLWQELIAQSEAEAKDIVFETEEQISKISKETLNEAINEILYQHDPLILIKFGLPDDEYTSEVEEIFAHLPQVSDVRSLKWSIYEVFLKYYPPESIAPYGDERYQFIAEKTWDLWQKVIEESEMKQINE